MSASFTRSIQLLGADRRRQPFAVFVLVAILLGGWAAWACLARVAVFKVCESARLEVIQAEHPVAAPVAGRVLATYLALGREVQVGDVLVELDAQCQQLHLEEKRTMRAALLAQSDVLRAERTLKEQALSHEGEADRAAIEEAHAEYRKAQAAAEQDQATLDHVAGLSNGHAAKQERSQAEAKARESRAAAEAANLRISRLEWNLRARQRDRLAHLEEQRAEITKVEGQASTAQAAIKRLEHEIERRTIRAPVSGRVGEVSALRVGSVLREGDKITAIVPAGKLQIVAHFDPAAAFGRIRPGQSARLRLHGFPWTQYGSVAAKVSRVGSVVRDGRVQVELAVTAGTSPLIPQEHGLPGTLEIEVERVSPATLLLRAAGYRFARPAPTRLADSSHMG